MQVQRIFGTDWMNNLTWTPTTRTQHMRDGLRFASGLSDPKWIVLKPLLSPNGRPLERPIR